MGTQNTPCAKVINEVRVKARPEQSGNMFVSYDHLRKYAAIYILPDSQ